MRTPSKTDVGNKIPEEGLDQSQCGVCSGEVLENSKAVMCDSCKLWYHKSCGKITDKLYNKILKASNDNPVEWICADCKRVSNKPINKQLTQAEDTSSSNLGQSTDDALTGHESVILTEEADEQTQNRPTWIDSVVTMPCSVLEALHRDLDQANQELIRAKQEIILLNQEAIAKSQTIIRLNGMLRTSSRYSSAPKKVNSLVDRRTTRGANKESGTANANPTEHDTVIVDSQDVSETDNNPTGTAQEERKTDVLIIGDSIIKGINDYIEPMQTENSPKIQVASSSGATIQDLSRYIAKHPASSLPQTVIVHIGTNNLKHSKTPNHVMRPLWYTIESAQKRQKLLQLEERHKNFSSTIWVINGILYRRDVPDWYIDNVNEALDFMCQQLKLVYRNPNPAVTGRGLGRDGLHLNAYGSRQLAEFIFSDISVQTKSLEEPSTAHLKEPSSA